MKTIFILLFLGFTLPGLHSQDKPNIIKHENINHIKKIYRTQKKISIESLRSNLSQITGSELNNQEIHLQNIYITPNPTNDIIKCFISLPRSGNAEISIFDLFGNKIITEKVNLNMGNNEIMLDLKNLNKGWYNISINDYQSLHYNQFIIKY